MGKQNKPCSQTDMSQRHWSRNAVEPKEKIPQKLSSKDEKNGEIYHILYEEVVKLGFPGGKSCRMTRAFDIPLWTKMTRQNLRILDSTVTATRSRAKSRRFLH